MLFRAVAEETFKAVQIALPNQLRVLEAEVKRFQLCRACLFSLRDVCLINIKGRYPDNVSAIFESFTDHASKLSM